MTTVRELVTVFGFQPDDRGLSQIEGVIDGLKTGFVAVAAAAAAGAATIFGIASSVASFGDDAIKTAQRLGLTAEQLQQLNFALQISGTSIEEQRGSIVRLARTANEAAQGVETYASVYRQLGVSVTDVNGDLKSTDALLLDLSDAFSRMPDGIEKTALAAELFGRRGTDMLQFLNLGADGIAGLMSEATALGGVMSTDVARQSEVFNDTLLRLKTAVNGVKLALGAELIPAITEVVQSILDFVNANRDVIRQRLSKFFQGVAKFVRLTGVAMLSLIQIAGQTVSALGGVESILSWLTFALTVLAINTIRTTVLPALLTFITGLNAATVSTAALNAATWLWNAAIAAIPLIITALIVLFAILIDDTRRFMEGQDSLIGRLLDRYGELDSGVSGSLMGILRTLRDVRDYGATAFALMAQDAGWFVDDVGAWFRRLGLQIRLIWAEAKEAAIDAFSILNAIPGVRFTQGDQVDAQGAPLAGSSESLQAQLAAEQGAAQRAIGERMNERFALSALYAERDAMARQGSANVDASTTVEGVTVNVNGGDPDAVREAVTQGISNATAQRQRELLRSLGLPAEPAGGV